VVPELTLPPPFRFPPPDEPPPVMSLPDGMPHPFVPLKGLYETPPARGGDFALSLLKPMQRGPVLIPDRLPHHSSFTRGRKKILTGCDKPISRRSTICRHGNISGAPGSHRVPLRMGSPRSPSPQIFMYLRAPTPSSQGRSTWRLSRTTGTTLTRETLSNTRCSAAPCFPHRAKSRIPRQTPTDRIALRRVLSLSRRNQHPPCRARAG
jgi:hypothetical protein